MENLDITKFIKEFELGCSMVKSKQFRKGEGILNYSDNQNLFCILKSGIANLVRYDYDGNKFVTERFYPNSIFSDVFYNSDSKSEYIVEAKDKCTVLFYPYNHFNDKCKPNCQYHKKMLEAFPTLAISKISSLTSRIEILSIKSTREKLLAYFGLMKKQYGNSFELPCTITELAATLAVDRSSMSRELSKLKKEKIIKQDRNRIKII